MQNLPNLSLSASYEEENRLIENHIRQLSTLESRLDILEAGCGQRWPLELAGVEYRLTGVDLDKKALEIRSTIEKDLHETIAADIRYANLDPESFHVIYSSFVLEHVENPQLALENFVKWLKPGGLLIIRVPDPDSVYGFISGLTPHWFHVFYYKYIVRLPNAGKPGYAPYATCYDPLMSREGIRDFCRQFGFAIREEYGHGFYSQSRFKRRWVILIKYLIRLTGYLSFGRLSWDHEYLFYILQKER